MTTSLKQHLRLGASEPRSVSAISALDLDIFTVGGIAGMTAFSLTTKSDRTLYRSLKLATPFDAAWLLT